MLFRFSEKSHWNSVFNANERQTITTFYSRNNNKNKPSQTRSWLDDSHKQYISQHTIVYVRKKYNIILNNKSVNQMKSFGIGDGDLQD